MEYSLVPFTAEDLPALLDGLVELYGRAFAAPPYNLNRGDVVAFEGALQRHVQRTGFYGLWACTQELRLAGFAYGYSGGPGQWWYDTVTSGMAPALVRSWLTDYFEFVELAVDPSAQGRGIGGSLHDALLASTSHPRAALTTADADTPARHLYARRGWVTLREGFYFPASTIALVVMGKKLTVNS